MVELDELTDEQIDARDVTGAPQMNLRAAVDHFGIEGCRTVILRVLLSTTVLNTVDTLTKIDQLLGHFRNSVHPRDGLRVHQEGSWYVMTVWALDEVLQAQLRRAAAAARARLNDPTLGTVAEHLARETSDG